MAKPTTPFAHQAQKLVAALKQRRDDIDAKSKLRRAEHDAAAAARRKRDVQQ